MYKNNKVLIKTKEELISEGFEVRSDGVYKGNNLYLNKSDLNYLGWEMMIVYKESEHYRDKKYTGFALRCELGYEIDMYNIDHCVFKKI